MSLPLGFGSFREVITYVLGAAALVYGVVAAPADRQLAVIGAALALLGAPIVGGIFDKTPASKAKGTGEDDA